jgi:DNA-binding SARP family transcriptional activator
VHDRPASELTRRRLIARCMDAQPRVVRLIARPGWGKTTFARQVASEMGDYAVVDCSGVRTQDDLDERLDAAFARRTACLVIDNVERVAEVPGAIARLRRAIDEHAATRRFVLASRVEFPVGAGRSVAPHDVVTLRAGDLAFDAAEVREVFAALALPEAELQRITTLSLGWPIAIFLFVRLAREGKLVAALADLSHASLDDLFEYGERETLNSWTRDEQIGIAAAVAIPGATAAEIEAAVGADARRAIENFALRGFEALVDGRFFVPELPAEGVRRFLRADVQRAAQNAIRNAVAGGARLRAAQIRLAGGDEAGAVVELEALGPHAADTAPSPEYAVLAKALSPAALLGSRNVLVAVLTDRETQAAPLPLLAVVEPFLAGLQRDSDPELVAGSRLAYGALLRMADRRREAKFVLETALSLGDPSVERTALLRANLAAVIGLTDLERAEALLAQAGVPRTGPTLFALERFEVELARNQVRADPRTRRATYERNVDEARRAGPIALAHAFRYLAAGAWLDGDEATSAAALAESNRLVDAMLPPDRRRVRTDRPRLEAPVERYGRMVCAWYMSAALLEEDVDTARRFVQIAVDGFVHIGAPFLETIAAVIAASLPVGDAAVWAARARANAAAFGEPALIAAVEAIVEQRYDDAGILLPFARRIERGREMRASKLVVEVFSGCVRFGDEQLVLREREFELLVMLALERRALTREALTHRLWPDGAPEEVNAALRTAVYRLRKQLHDPRAVESTAKGYRLAQAVHVDMLEAEQFVSGARRFDTLSDRERARLAALLDQLAHGPPSVYGRWEWFRPYEERLRDLLHDVGILLAEDDLRRGDTAAAIARAEALLRADALDESANEIVIRAHVAAGRKSEAYRRYRRYRDALDREYGVAPGSELSALLEAL